MIEIKRRITGAVIRTVDAQTLRDANLSDADLSDADLSYANLRNANLRYANLRYANLRGADLSGAYLSDANLSGAYLRDAYLSGAYLSGAHLSGANLGGENFSAPKNWVDAPGLLDQIATRVAAGNCDMHTWHTCETTHCLAGWAIHLSGPAGYLLEKTTSPSVAGAMLVPSIAHLFYASNDEAMEWAKKYLADKAGNGH
jgi:uncharacterized protein YjbI with pentapeptide repeats